ncbi:MAG: hypothetical protein JWM37_462 [Candidatus Saccharibacteria bacterium]|nr:hypothetical protein [Candidatus Saccharibacteria bacterium]
MCRLAFVYSSHKIMPKIAFGDGSTFFLPSRAGILNSDLKQKYRYKWYVRVAALIIYPLISVPIVATICVMSWARFVNPVPDAVNWLAGLGGLFLIVYLLPNVLFRLLISWKVVIPRWTLPAESTITYDNGAAARTITGYLRTQGVHGFDESTIEKLLAERDAEVQQSNGSLDPQQALYKVAERRGMTGTDTKAVDIGEESYLHEIGAIK